MHVAHDLTTLLEIEIPGVRIDLLRERRIRPGPACGLLYLLAVAVVRLLGRRLAICSCQLLVERVQSVGFGVHAGAGGERSARAELGFRDIELPSADDGVCGKGRTGEAHCCK